MKAPPPPEIVDRLCRNLIASGFSEDAKTRDYAISLIEERVSFIEGLGDKVCWRDGEPR